MSKKRVADKQLTDLNWQDEEEPEEAGEFRKADDTAIKKRVIKTARRRLPPGGSDGAEKTSLFAGFAGFGAPKLNPTPTVNLGTISNTNGDTAPIFGSSSKPAADTVSSSTPSDKPPAENNDAFLKKLKKLNESVLKFAREHIEKNPFVILSSVFSDYERHLKRIRNSQNGSTSSTDVTPVFNLNPTSEVTPTKVEAAEGEGNMDSAKKEEEEEEVKEVQPPKEEAKPLFSFGAATGPTFSFGATTATAATTGGFSFKPATSVADSTQSSGGGGFSFKPAADSSTTPTTSLFGKPVGMAATFTGFGGLVGGTGVSTTSSAPAQSSTQEEEEEDKPPVAEKVDHVDSEAIFHIKCKLFIKSDSGWNEKGIGIANLKKCNDKVQLLIRNDTTMGTVIMNTLLHDKMPISKSGKNSIMIIATNEDSKTETFLLRVNKDKLDEFFDKLEECKTSQPA